MTSFHCRTKPSWRALTVAFAAGATLCSLTPPARACGGFWCSQSAPVNQTSEQIVFIDNPDDTTTCIVQIQYAGPSERFAWVLPVLGVPDISVSSNLAFQRLGQATQPQYVLNRHVEGECDRPSYHDNGPLYAAPGAGGALASAPEQEEPRVVVLASGSVGPYDYAVIRPNATLADPAQVAIDWLEEEGYDIAGISGEVLGPYLADGHNLIAFRLTKGNMSGSIRPVILKYPGELPTIPIRPTAVAAQNDMGIQVWVLGKQQAVPRNYRSLILNEALINWFNPQSTYDAVVTAAADEADGQGFVTELAGDSDVLDDLVFSQFDAQGWQQLQQQTFADPIDLMWAANNRYRDWDGWRETIEAAVTLPEGSSFDDFGRNPDAFRDMPGFGVDTELFMELLRTDVVEPMQQTQELLDAEPYVTRLYSTMSAEEMTVDPVFTFNPDLAPISNVHEADLYVECRAGILESEAPWRIELAGGGAVRGSGQQGTWPVSPDSMPANRRIVQLSESGAGEVIEDNRYAITSEIVDRGGMNTPPSLKTPPRDEGMMIGGPEAPLPPIEPRQASDGGGCAVASGPAAPARTGAAGALLGLAALMGLGRRRTWPTRRAWSHPQ